MHESRALYAWLMLSVRCARSRLSYHDKVLLGFTALYWGSRGFQGKRSRQLVDLGNLLSHIFITVFFFSLTPFLTHKKGDRRKCFERIP